MLGQKEKMLELTSQSDDEEKKSANQVYRFFT